MMKRFLVTAVMIGVALSACGRYFAPDRNLKSLLSEEAIIGKWHLSQSSLDLLVADGFEMSSEHKYTLDLHPGGSCEFASVSDSFRGGEYISAPCEWSLEHDTRGDSNIKKKNALRLSINGTNRTLYRYLHFARDDEELVMWNYYGDPDS
jgi:hypothetical protein